MPTEHLDWASLSDYESGYLGRPAAPDTLRVPDNIDVENDEVRFDFSSGIRVFRPPVELLQRFVSTRSDAGLVAFAKKYGPLGLFSSDKFRFGLPNPKKLSAYRGLHHEQLEWWRGIQKQFQVVLALIASIKSEEVPTTQALAELETVDLAFFQPMVLEAPEAWGEKDRRDMALIAGLSYTRMLAEWCGLRPALAVNWRSANSSIDLVFQDSIAHHLGGGLSLFGALTVQLMAAIAGSGFALCSGCGEAFIPKRRQPAFGRRRYCSRCGRAAALRDAKAAYRARQRKEAKSGRRMK